MITLGTMTAIEEQLIMELQCANERNAQLVETLEQLKSQLLDTHAEDSILITIINTVLDEH
jgi:hypothetical protein|tara:strand:+ start:1266 stop:1448 length:183 start_codon:yes stop_codon:yes gene_type:complete